MRVQESNGRKFVTLPKYECQLAGIVKGDFVIVSYNERGNLEVRKVKK